MYITTADVNKAKETYIMQIGKTIRKYRKEKGLTQEEMANTIFSKQLKQELLHLFQDKETYAFLKDNERWQKLIQQ